MTFRPKHWITFATASKLGLLLLCLGTALPRSAGDCAPLGVGFYGYSFINPNILGLQSSLAPYFMNISAVYGEYFTPQSQIQQDDNLAEWQERFCKKASLPDLQAIIYDASISVLEEIRAAILNPEDGAKYLPAQVARNSFVRHLLRYECIETVDYLIFAKRCERYVTLQPGWEESRQRDKMRMQSLIEDAKRFFLQTESHYINLRYAYQAIRLAHYMKDYRQTLNLYAYYIPKIDNDPSLIEYWILGHRAGALRSLGQNVEASYYYSRIFDECPSKRESAYRSFLIRSDEEWEACLRLCKNDHERASLYTLRANANDARLIEEMVNIYQLDPKHPALELLLVREVSRLERDLLALDINQEKENNRRYFGIPRPGAGEKVIDLQAFVRRVLEEGQLERPALWKIAEGYLELLAGDFYFAAKTFGVAEKMVEDKQLQEQLEVFRLVLEILSLDEVTEQNEQKIARLRRDNEWYQTYGDFAKLLRDKMIELYSVDEEAGKAFLLQYSLSDLKGNLQLNVIEDLLELATKDDPNRLEKQFIENAGGRQLVDDLTDLKATYYLERQEVERALEVFKLIDRTRWDDYGKFNPFVSRFADCVNCELPDSVAKEFNKGEVMEELIRIQYDAQAATDQEDAARRFYRLGTAYYNMTYFGRSWQLTDYFRSSISVRRALRNKGQDVFSHRRFPFGNKENFDCTRARSFFERARMMTRNPELAARATYGAAKCERNEYYTKTPEQLGRSYDNFGILLKEYSDTDFFQRVLLECKTFRAYAAR